MKALTDTRYAQLVKDEQTALTTLRDLLARTNTETHILEQLDEVISHLDALFLVVVVGEFNAGKSSVLNAFFGEQLMEEGPIPTTAKVTIVRYGEEAVERQLSEFLVEKRIPSPHLKNPEPRRYPRHQLDHHAASGADRTLHPTR